MCLALPALVVELVGTQDAVVDLDGVRKQISLALLDDVAVGDYIILHVGFALQKLDVAEAEATLALFRELEQADPTCTQPAPEAITAPQPVSAVGDR